VHYDPRPVSRRVIAPLAFVTLLTGAWLLSHATFAELDVVWLSLAPVFLLALPLVAGRYVGETHLERLSAGRRPRPRRLTGGLRMRAPRPRAGRIGHGLLLARHVAGRAPPAAAALAA
jgi:hypothetical protein